MDTGLPYRRATTVAQNAAGQVPHSGKSAVLRAAFRQSRSLPSEGQALIELLVSVSIFVTVIGGVIGVFMLSTKARTTASLNTALKGLAQQSQQEIINIARRDWGAIYGTAKGSGNLYTTVNQGGVLALQAGSETLSSGGVSITRSIYFETAFRDGGGNIAASGTEDKSTHKAVVVLTSERGSYQSYFYVTRWANRVAAQASWKSGPGAGGPVAEFTGGFATSSNVNYGTTSIQISTQ